MNKKLLTTIFAELLVKRYLNKNNNEKNSIEAMAEIIVGDGLEKEITISQLQEILFKDA